METTRNLGVDLLRSLSMFMVVVLHVLGQGGILAALDAAPVRGGSFVLCWLLELACYCAVDCFGLISGYVSQSQVFEREKNFATWAQVAFWSAGITLLFRLFVPGTTRFRDVGKACFPAITRQYWYFTAYFGLMFFIPFLNILLHHLDRAQTKSLMTALLVLFSLLPTVLDRDLFFTKAGYTLLWLTVLYLLGACVRKLDLLGRLPGWACLAGYLLCVLTALGLKLLFRPGPGPLPPMGRFLRPDLLVSYTSPAVLFSALFLLALFRKLRVPAGLPARTVGFLAPLAFGVYLIHTHPLVWAFFLRDRFASYAQLPPLLCAGAALLTAGGIFLACTALEFCRHRVFRLLLPPVSARLFRRGGRQGQMPHAPR